MVRRIALEEMDLTAEQYKELEAKLDDGDETLIEIIDNCVASRGYFDWGIEQDDDECLKKGYIKVNVYRL